MRFNSFQNTLFDELQKYNWNPKALEDYYKLTWKADKPPDKGILKPQEPEPPTPITLEFCRWLQSKEVFDKFVSGEWRIDE